MKHTRAWMFGLFLGGLCLVADIAVAWGVEERPKAVEISVAAAAQESQPINPQSQVKTTKPDQQDMPKNAVDASAPDKTEEKKITEQSVASLVAPLMASLVVIVMILLLAGMLLRVMKITRKKKTNGARDESSGHIDNDVERRKKEDRSEAVEDFLLFILAALFFATLIMLSASLVVHGFSGKPSFDDGVYRLSRVFGSVLAFMASLMVYFRWQDAGYKKELKEEMKDNFEERFLQIERKIRDDVSKEAEEIQRDTRHLVALAVSEGFERERGRRA